jgi:hypothetical protein
LIFVGGEAFGQKIYRVKPLTFDPNAIIFPAAPNAIVFPVAPNAIVFPVRAKHSG